LSEAGESEARLAKLESDVAGHVRWICEAASAAPPGGNRGWDRVLAHYGASADPPVTRLEEVAKAGQARGATLKEVRGALEAMSAGAVRELDAIASSAAAHGQLEGRIGRLRGWLSRVADEETNRFAAAVCPPRAVVAASVGGIFANVQATAKQTPWANLKFDPANVLECPACGAPQERALDFACRYCRGPMAAPAGV
jgi:hypothetical protein